MMADVDSGALRRYLLGQAGDDEAAAIEREYFASDAAAERVGAVEGELIEEYLDARLGGAERRRFEEHYLASPVHRTRVEVIRRLGTAAAKSAPGNAARRPGLVTWLAAAAVLLLAVFVASRFVPAPHSTAARQTPAAPAASPAPRRAFAVQLPVISVRGANDATPIVIPPGTDDVSIELEAEPGAAPVRNGRAAITEVGGGEVWQGDVAGGTPPPGIAAVVSVPAARLRTDDYIVVLVSRADGAESEYGRYVLRVRDR